MRQRDAPRDRRTANSLARVSARASSKFARLAQAISSTRATIGRELDYRGVHALQDQIDRNISSERVLSFLSMLFSALATLLCGIGLYGLIAYSVSRRTRKIGIRYAIGAQKADVARLFLRESLLLIVAGIVLGVPLALASSQALKSLLYGIEPADARTLIVTVAMFLVAGFVASVLPVRQAARIEPLEALRHE